MSIGAVFFQQFLWGPLLGYAPAVQHHDLICTCDCAHAVSDDKNRPVLDQAGKSGLDERLILHVKRSSCLIQKDDRCIFQKCPGDGDPLALTSGEHTAVFTDVGVPFVRKLFGKFIAAGKLRCGKDVLVCSFFPADTDILYDRIVKQSHILKDDREEGEQFFRICF